MPEEKLLQFTTEIVAAFVQKNRVEPSLLPSLITAVYSALQEPEVEEASEPALARPSSRQISRSITHDALISFEDGRAYTMLKRHLSTLGLTPEAYRAKWGLPATYPMVAPSYSARRSEFAKASGLGSRTRGGKGKRK